MRQGSQGEARAVAAADGAGGVTVGVRRPSRCAHGFSDDTRNRDPPTRGGCS
ncbi:protein of unassigned function [Methylobacterium oryzae CBMB20]|uniref:Protein of unassigned function n=1 Tax=Methylobacterium oryzae CBMB20 TaxID=693986 RepID=A0A089NVT2_9HYPH|nr:protein of unassigned function [Methylobacterium oryzae CBMB20]